jgi:hypothetical protein
MYTTGLRRVLVTTLKGMLVGAILVALLALLLTGPQAVPNAALVGGALGSLAGGMSLLGYFLSDRPEDEKALRWHGGAHPKD